MHGPVWAVAPDPASSHHVQPHAARWTAGWAALSAAALEPLLIHLPAPASARARVDLSVFSVVRTRKVLEHQSAPQTNHDPTHQRSPQKNGIKPPQQPTASSATITRSHSWQVELLAAARPTCPPVTWSDSDTGANVAGQLNVSAVRFEISFTLPRECSH